MSSAQESKKSDALEAEIVVPVFKTPIIDPVIGEIPPEYAALDGDDESGGLPTIADVGNVLPIGYRDATGKIHRDFELVTWDWEIEEELGDLAEQNQGMTMGTYISEVVGRGLVRLGELDFTKLKRSQRRLVVSQLYYADVIYVYVCLRIVALGKNFRFDEFKCDSCGFEYEGFAGDLSTLEVKVVDGDEIPTKSVELGRPFRYAGIDAAALVVGPLKWAFMETADVSTLTNSAKFRVATLRSGVIGVEGVDNGAPVVLTREHVKQLGPKTVNRLVAEIDEIGGGAVMEIAGKCPKCPAKVRRAIDWTYDNFFGRSSR